MDWDDMMTFFHDVERRLEAEHADDAWTARDLLEALKAEATKRFCDQFGR